MEAGWAAGIIDGEGCINLGWQSGGGVRYRVVVEMNHRDTVRELYRIMNVGSVRRTKRGTYRWTAAAKDAETALNKVSHLLVTKWKQAELLLRLASLVSTRPLGVPTPPMLRRRYAALIKRCHVLNAR